jgi:hypothetical protein
MGKTMDKEIVCVYQDCVMCGDRGKELKKYIDTNGLTVRKVSFASDEGKELVHEAVFVHKIKKMPFFTDGQKFAEKISDFVKKPEKKVRAKKNEHNS